jgi:hypothetical protein
MELLGSSSSPTSVYNWLTPLACFSCCPSLSSSGVHFILDPCCTEVAGYIGLNSFWLVNCCCPSPAQWSWLRVRTHDLILLSVGTESLLILLLELWLVWHASLCSLVADCLGDIVLSSTLTVVVSGDLCMLSPDNGYLFYISVVPAFCSLWIFNTLSHYLPHIVQFLHNICQICPYKPVYTQIAQSYLLEQKRMLDVRLNDWQEGETLINPKKHEGQGLMASSKKANGAVDTTMK